MSNLIEEWKNKKDFVGDQAKKTVLTLSKLKAKEVNQTANKFHDEVISELDCLDCANCCTNIPPLVNDVDAKRIAKFLGIGLKRFQAEYLTKDEDGDTVMKTVPCIFLEGDNKCRIYEVRPKACREYPHTDDFQFMKNLKLHLTNVKYCPIVFHVIEKFKSV